MNMNLVLNLPEEVKHIIKKLNDNNHKAYVVGGCVRDSILNRQPKDWDVSTSATPEEVKILFDKTIDTGIKHGTVSILLNNCITEVTTFKTGTSQDNINLFTDLSYRDLTINAIAFHPSEGLFDPHSGVKDINNGIIRAVGNPDDRYTEDPLRMLRAIRFCAVLGFDMDKTTLDAIKRKKELIKNISQERIRDELSKILMSERPLTFAILRETGILKYILPEFDLCFDVTQNHPYHVFNVASHSLIAVSAIENLDFLRWTMLLHDTGKALTKSTDEYGIDHFYGHPEKSIEITKAVLERLKFDNKTISKVCHLVKYHDKRINPEYKSVRRAASIIGAEYFLDLLKVQEADQRGQNPELLEARLENLYKIREIYLEITKKPHCLSIKDLQINGTDLVNLGYPQGKEIGYILQRLLDTIIDKPELNTRDELLKIADSYKMYTT
ncbi:MAG: CCA-adding enzyme [Firmicutes bacterium ADurb.Bin419]|nr:MAG: CCA-adding enzyme [Firmicutes bacterium ADurb.Bin419]